MDQSYIPSRLGVFRISSEDQIYRKHLAKPGKKYLFVLAEHYPESLSDALAIIYFPGVPRGLCTAKIYIRDEFSNVNGNVVTASGSCGGVFRKLADVTAKELAGFSIEVSRVGKSRPQVFGNAASFLAAQHPTGSDDEDQNEEEIDDLAGEKVKIGLHFRRIIWGDPVYSTWEEVGSEPIDYIACGKLVGDQTNGQKVMTIHQFTHKPSKAKFSLELVKNRSGEYLLFREHRLPVLAMTALHGLLALRYWASALNDDPQTSEEISKARYENPCGQ